MNLGKATGIFRNIFLSEHTEAEKKAAIKVVLDMETHNGITKREILNALDWLYQTTSASLGDGWIPSETLPERNMRVQALIKHHKWITDYDSDWVPEEEKTVHLERLEICEAIYKNGKFTFRRMEDDEFMETAHISPKENIAEPVSEILMWRPFTCAWDNWISAEYPPETDTYILLSFSNFSLPLIGRYEADGDGGAFYLGDCDGEDTCISNDLYVNAWQPLPQQYHTEEG